jgi:hypothetical protein
VQLPAGVSLHQCRLLARVVAAAPQRRDRGGRRAVEPAPGEAEERLEQLASTALEASEAAEKWLQDRLPQQPHRGR